MNLEKNWHVHIRNSVHKQVAEFPEKDGEKLTENIYSLSNNPFAGDIIKMKGENNTWRKRVGSYRIFYEILMKERVVYVFHIERRTSKTY